LVINRFDGDGVEIPDAASGNKVQGNFVGTNAAGTADRGNSDGVSLDSTRDNTIGGATSGARNVISGNEQNGVEIQSSNAMGNKVQGNRIGTNANGNADLGNSFDGVRVASADNTIGGTESGARNVISGNEDEGVAIFSPAGDSKVEGNFIGTTADGTGDLGNTSNGVRIFASNTTIGGTTRAAGNVIAFSKEGDGVFIFSGVRNRILSNRIFANGGLGIALGTDGVTNNDADDPNTTQPDPDKDTGANNL
jgi:hypothetical protein